MAHLTYSSPGPYGSYAAKELHYSQAVRIGDRIECSGQNGQDPQTLQIPPSLSTELHNAFINTDSALKAAGGTGWDQIYMVRTYHTGAAVQAAVEDAKAGASNEGEKAGARTEGKEVADAGLEMTKRWIEKLKEWCPGHCPLWTAVGCERLAFGKQRVEVEVVAHVPG